MYSFLIDEHVSASGVSRAEVRKGLDAQLNEPFDPDEAQEYLADRMTPDDSAFGDESIFGEELPPA